MHLRSKELTLPERSSLYPWRSEALYKPLRLPSLRVFVYLRALAMPDSGC